MRIQVLLPLLLLVLGSLGAQPCTFLAYDGFNYPDNTPLNNLSGGTGWSSPWDVQGGNASLPGFQTYNTPNALTFSDLQMQPGAISGGNAYLTAGRRLNTDPNGPFSTFIGPGGQGIGNSQTGTLYCSVLLKKLENNGEPVLFSLHNENISWYVNNPNPKISLGYFGAASDAGGNRYWSIQINGTVYRTPVTVLTNRAVFMVLRLGFSNGTTQVDAWVNPTAIGDVAAPTPVFSQSINSVYSIRSVGVYLGDNAGSGLVDEIRLAHTYACVAPNAASVVNLPPNAVVSANPITGQAPLTVTLQSTSSSDPEGSALSYTWNFGDGTPGAIGPSVTHTFNTVGQITVALTVTDNLGLQHTDYQTITVLDAAGKYPCQSSFSVLNMPSCTANDGRIKVQLSNQTIMELRNAANNIVPINNGNEFHDLAPGMYQFTATGAGGCADQFQLNLVRDTVACAGQQAPLCAMSIGTNLGGFADWSPERPMKNLMKHVRWQPIPYTNNCNCWSIDSLLEEIQVDSNGYPTVLPQMTSAGASFLRIVLSADGGNLQPNHTYVLLYDGAGTIEMRGGVGNVLQTPGRIQFDVNDAGNIWMHWVISEAGNHLRNVRLLRLEDEQADLDANPFYQGFLDKIAPFKMLRFMDWGATNNNPNVQWSDRKGTDYFTYATPSGVPYETMIELANQTQKDVWICVPHAADDAYIAQMAQLFKSKLDPKRKVYLEYSNEVWNWIFQQAHYNDQNRPGNLNYPRAYAEKAKRVFRIWHTVYGAEKSRVKRVLGIQTLYNSLNEQILAQLPQSEWDFGAPTFYFGLDHGNTGKPVLNQSSTPQNIIDNARNAWYQNISGVKQDYDQIKLFGKGIIAYEGGQHFVGNVFGIPYDYQEAMWTAQRTPEMYALYDEVLDSIRNWGCQLAGNFSLCSRQESVYGSWGVLSDIDNAAPYLQSAPKYQALLDNNCLAPEQTPPVAGFSTQVTSGCAPLSVQYTAENPDNNIEAYQWVFPGGTPDSSTEANPTVVYTLPGTYSANLIVSNLAGKDTLAKNNLLTVKTAPVANYNVSVFGSIGIFTSTSTGGTSYAWDFGDGTSSNQPSPFHTFSEDGVYAVQLTVTNECGTHKITKEVTVATNPTASFTYSVSSGCAPLSVQFTSTSSSNSQSFLWSFPGGTPASSTQPNPVVVFYTPGSFSASLTVSNAVGQNISVQNGIITANDVPAAYFNPVAQGAVVTLNNASIGGGTYNWSFGDGNGSTLSNPLYTYSAEGTYTITLTATNPCGSASFTQTVQIVFPPTASFIYVPASGCAPLTVQYKSTSSDNSETLAWSFPGGSPATSTLPNPNVVYNAPGIYSASLTASNSAGENKSSQVDIVTVGSAPSVGFGVILDTNAAAIQCTNYSIDATSYMWDFGDGTTASEANPTHVYAALGNYTVALTAMNACGETTGTQQVQISVTGTDDLDQKDAFSLYPNPNTGNFWIKMPENLHTAIQFVLYNELGQKVQQVQLPANTTDRLYYFEEMDLAAGFYLLEINSGANVQQFKVMVQR